MPDGLESDGESWYVTEPEYLVFLTRQEATAYAEARKYRYDKWRVYCIPCDGELARILNEYEL